MWWLWVAVFAGGAFGYIGALVLDELLHRKRSRS